MMKKTEQAIKDYGLDFTLRDSSSAGMSATLANKIKNKEWVIVTWIYRCDETAVPE
ncbi:substrate-binding region of ABC-type glycine betaine transport system [Desulfofarcimen acetoxidans DSM 771]|uniref:Substrate-binding region of ABC-type glycine betaine transport system n=1 Tax=Desulfofarcimen acetoxidans (strain ATCC 49208 / DSM 771 / KCTC 5769 / VKM B-1644 / 5575) TaxID=485916 RepID=C8W5X4_DESAS|nr:substrate-binding region of ABC-type glycine betaine transport system [Desulfofarcimen acetoxidans DSM 771]